METEIIYGPPGTGKTTFLLDVLEKELETNDPDKIAFVSFTKKGAYEAKDRAREKFGFTDNDLPYFRTLHSLAFMELAMSPKQMMRHKDYKYLSGVLGININSWNVDDPFVKDRYLFLDSYSRNRLITLADVWHELGEEENWYRLKQVIKTINLYKEEKGYYDFTDLIEMFVERNRETPVDIAIIDEAQDLTSLQWKMVNTAFRDVKKMYIAGDDDQSIFKWAGADVNYFLNLQGKKTYLQKSYRLPKAIYDLSCQIVNKISRREEKEFSPRDEGGSVGFHNYLDEIELDSGSWLLLARNRYLLAKLEEWTRIQGRVYKTKEKGSVEESHWRAIYGWEDHRKGKPVDEETMRDIQHYSKGVKPKSLPWHDAFTNMPLKSREYYRAILRRGGNLRRDPNILIETIHSVKGGEADSVVMLLDMSYKTWKHYQKDSDDENRVFYVGATRARENLHLVYPDGNIGFEI